MYHQKMGNAYLVQPRFKLQQLAFLDHEGLIVEVLNDVVVLVLVDLENNGFDGGVAFDEDAWGLV